MSAVSFVDSAGLRAVIEIEGRARQRGLRFRIVPPPEDVRAVFRLSGAESLLPLAIDPHVRPDESDYPERVALELQVGDSAPRRARAELREAIAGKLSRPESEVAVLLTSELVTNAVIHPRHGDDASIGLRIGTDMGRLQVEVADSGRGFDPSKLTRDDTAPGGRGLLVVDRGAARWGTRQDDRFCVWFELAEPAAGSGPAVHADSASLEL